MCADNQQERLEAEWIVGFVDGEGCFFVGFNRQPKMTVGWQVLPEFRIVQHMRDEQILNKLREYFGFGSVVINNGDRMEFRVRGIIDLTKIVEFFKRNPLRTRKKKDFEKFAHVIRIIQNGQHLKNEGLRKAAQLAVTMNRKCNTTASRILRDCTPDTEKQQ